MLASETSRKPEMGGRSGPPVKIIFYALFLIGFVYILYIYHSTNGRLRDAQNLAERYRREEEMKLNQLQDVLKAKEELQEKCDNDRQDFVSRLGSLNQQHKMLKGRNEEIEADYGRLQQELQKLKEDQQHLESQREQEFHQLKQEKELEIASLKDQVANFLKQNEQLQNEISSLKAQLKNFEANNAALQQQQQQQQNQAGQIQNQVGQQQNQIGQQQNQIGQQQNQIGQQAAQQALGSQQQHAQAALAGQQQQEQQGQQQPIIQPGGQPVGVAGQGNVVQSFQAKPNVPLALQQQGNLVQAQQGSDVQKAGSETQHAQDNAVNESVKDNVANNEQTDAKKDVGMNPIGVAAVQQQDDQQAANGADDEQKLSNENGYDDKANNDVNAQHQVQPPNDVNEPAHVDKNEAQNFELKHKLVDSNGQIIKPDFKQNEDIMNQKFEKLDNFQNNNNNIDINHDNRIQHEGPVGLQVQEPGGFVHHDTNIGDGDNGVIQMAAHNKQYNPFEHESQIDLPQEDNKLKKSKVNVEGEDYNDQQYDNYKYDNQEKEDANGDEDDLGELP